jgi:hypothetical protein
MHVRRSRRKRPGWVAGDSRRRRVRISRSKGGDSEKRTILLTAAGLAAALCTAAPLAADEPVVADSPRVRRLLAEMTLEEKVGQLSLRGRGRRYAVV